MYKTIFQLKDFEIIRGVFTLVFVIISILIGIRILLKYFSLRQNTLLAVGLTWIFISSSWWGNAFSFLSIVIFQYAFGPFEYLLVQNAFVPLALMSWVYALAELTYPLHKYKLIIFYYSICIIYLIYLIASLLIDPALIGVQKGGIFDYERKLIPTLFTMFILINATVLGLLFSVKAMKSEDPRVKWKGRFLFIALASFVILSAIDTLTVGEEFLLIRVIVRLLLITSGIEFYFAFFLPKGISERLLVE